MYQQSNLEIWFLLGAGATVCSGCCSIGNIGPLLSKEYPSCWKKYKTCSKRLTQVCCLHGNAYIDLCTPSVTSARCTFDHLSSAAASFSTVLVALSLLCAVSML